MNYLNFFLVFFLVSFLMIGSQIYEVDLEKGIERDIYNYTENAINLPQINISGVHPIEQTKGVINEGRLYLIIESGVNFLLVSTEQIVKMGIEFGYQNPDINYDKIFYYFKWLIIAIILFYLIKPIGYIIIFIIMLAMMLYDKIRNKKYKK